MIQETIEKLQDICDNIPLRLRDISEDDFIKKATPEKWSKKQILGHLLDSATNNHQRFIRIQFENEPGIFYDQNRWVELQNYEQIESGQLISFWESYNRHLIHVLKQIPEGKLKLTSTNHAGDSVTLEYLIHDYLAHLQHHINQITDEK